MPQELTPRGLAEPTPAVANFMNKVIEAILNPLIGLLFSVAVVYFLWGLFVFIKEQDNADAQEEGKRHMLWGIVGIFLMFAVYGILEIVVATVEPIGQ